MVDVSDFAEQPRLKVVFPGGDIRFVHAHYEQPMGLHGPCMDEFPQLVPDAREGIIFTQTIDGRWFAHEGMTS